MSKWTKVGTIMKRKSGNGNYVKVAEDIKLAKGSILNVQNPRKRAGITEEQLAKIPDFVVAEIYLPPAEE